MALPDFMNWGKQNQTGNNIMNGSQALIPGMDSNDLAYMNGLGEQTGGPGFMDGMLGYTDENGIKKDGWGSLALGGANGLLNGWLGMKKLGMAKDQLRENKRQFNMNWGAQKKTTNNALYNAQVSRNSSEDPSKNKDMGSYMSKWGIE